jgi:uncharacterized protein YbjT (DUF2867 family)
MRIAVAGGTGTVGSFIVSSLRSLDHEVRVLSRHSSTFPVDLSTGTGLAIALDGCDAVVDAAQGGRQTLVDGSRRLLAAAREAGVGHHVCVSIVGCDLVPIGYYKLKTAQEAVVAAGDVPWTIVRATQFHELLASAFRRLAVFPVPGLKLQTVSSHEVGAAVADFATQPARLARVEVAGPTVTTLRSLAEDYRRVAGRRMVLVPMPLPGRIGRALRGGALTSANPDVTGKVDFATWLATR